MDIAEERYRKIIATFRPLVYNVIYEYPIPSQVQLQQVRNLKYIIQKQRYSNNISFSLYAQIPQQIKDMLNQNNIQSRLLVIRLIRCLPFHFRVKVIQETQNELSTFVMRQAQSVPSPDRKTTGYNSINTTPEFHYQSTTDMIDLLLSVYELTSLSEQIYFDVNQKITAILSHMLEKCSSTDRNVVRNSYQALRALFLVFSECKGRAKNKKKQTYETNDRQIPKVQQTESSIKSNKLINKIISILSKDQNFQLPSSNSSMLMNSGSNNNHNTSSNPRLRQLIMKTREYEIRVRCRMLTGICYLLTYIPQYLPELYQLVTQQIFIILENANQLDINLQCFLSIKAILALPLSHYLRSSLIKKWVEVLTQLSNTYKKQYFPFFILILRQVCQYDFCPLKVKYFVSTSFLEITKSIQQQLSRFIVYKFSCKNIMMITNFNCPGSGHTNSNKIGTSKSIIKKEVSVKSNNIIINIFHYDWFVSRVKQQNDLFKSQFLICLLHAYFTYPKRLTMSNKVQIRDLLDLCHYMLVWSSNCKQQANIPTVKFAFDIYLEFLKQAAWRLGHQIQKYVIQLIDKCNGPTMSLLFKFKLIAALIKLQCYSASIMTYSQVKLKLDFLQGQIQLFMMPKNSKPIFDYQYSLTADGEIESRKQIETIKVIMDLLSAIQQVYKNDQKTIQLVNSMVMRYHEYLSNLQAVATSNKDLIHCLQLLQADHYFTVCQRNFLLSLIDEQDSKGNNIQYTLNDKIVFSPFQNFDSDQEYNIFGGMSPVHLKIRLLGGRSYTSVYIEAKKNQWVGLPEMKLIVSSAIEVKQVPFESCIIEIKIDRSGLINFQAWTTQGNPILLGSGSHRINRKFLWLQVNHLRVIDGIRCRGFLSKQDLIGGKQTKNMKDQTYLTYCFGEPVLLQILYSKNEIVVTVNNKQVWNEVQELIWKMVEQLLNGTAEIIKNQ